MPWDRWNIAMQMVLTDEKCHLSTGRLWREEWGTRKVKRVVATAKEFGREIVVESKKPKKQRILITNFNNSWAQRKEVLNPETSKF